MNLEKVVLLVQESTQQALVGYSISGTIISQLTTGIQEEASNYSDVDGNALGELLGGGNTISGVTGAVLTINSEIGSTSDQTPTISFQSLLSGTIKESCTEKSIEISAGTNVIELGVLADGTYANCTLVITDYEGDTKAITIPAFTVDTAKPTISNFSINNSTSATVSITLNASDSNAVVSYNISENSTETPSTDANWLNYSSQFIDFSFANAVVEEKTLYAWVRDQAGNVSSSVVDTVQLLDNMAPYNLSISIANGISHVNSDAVQSA